MLFLESTELDYLYNYFNEFRKNNMHLFYKNKMCGTFQDMYKNRVFTNFGILQQKWKVFVLHNHIIIEI